MVRVYIHNVPGFVGSALAEILSQSDHEIVGSYFEDKVTGSNNQVGGTTKAVTEMAPLSDMEKINALIMSSDTVIYSAAEPGALDHTRAALRLLKRGGYEGTKQFILISSVMTWARTKISGETAETGLKEETFTKRKSAASCSELKTLETQTMALSRENLQTFVVAPGLMYGAGEKTLHALFRQSWLCTGPLPIVHSTRNGANILPMIHVKDMARVVASTVATPPASNYVVCVDKSRSTLREVVVAISTGLGNRGTVDLTREETQDLMLSDPDVGALNMHVYFDVDTTTSTTIGIEWGCEEGFVANATSVIQEYTTVRDLRPVRLVVNGPPSCNATSQLANKLSTTYYIPLITPYSAVASALYVAPTPEPEVQEVKEGEEKEEGEDAAPEVVEPTEEEVAANALREEINAVGVNAENNVDGGDLSSIPDTLMCRIIQVALSTRACQNQGWVLQGYPQTWREATGLWSGAGTLEEGDAEDTGDVDSALPEADESGAYTPTGVVLLDGADEWLMECAMESEMKEEEFAAALTKYRSRNADANERSVASFFESVLRIDTLSHAVTSDTNMDAVLNDTCLSVESGGTKSFNYHPTPEEEAEALRTALEESKRSSEAAASAEALQQEQEAHERNIKQEEQKRRLDEIKAQEDELLEARSAPLRAYLMKHVIPTLTEGLIETCKVMPNDPVDYLAEFMFRASPAVESKTATSDEGKKQRK